MASQAAAVVSGEDCSTGTGRCILIMCSNFATNFRLVSASKPPPVLPPRVRSSVFARRALWPGRSWSAARFAFSRPLSSVHFLHSFDLCIACISFLVIRSFTDSLID